MTSRRRAVVLSGLSLVLGGLAASDVGGREAALRRRIGPVVPVVVARAPIAFGARIAASALAVRQVPARWAPAGAFAAPGAVTGLRATVAIPAGADLVAGLVDDGAIVAAGAPVRPGERVADLVAVGSPALVVPGARVDVVVTRGGEDGNGRTEVALEDVDVLAAHRAPETAADDGVARVAVSLRVTLRQAVYLAAAQSFAREIRLLRAPRVTTAALAAWTVGAGL